MAEFKGEEILQALRLNKSKSDCFPVKRVVTDSRKVKEGDLYVALKGENFDGHQFLDQAVQSGAKAVVIQKENSWESDVVDIYRVENTLIALGELAAFHRNKFSIPVIGITGSVGKTSTKELLAAALGDDHKVLKTQGNFNNEIGLPLTLLELNENHRYAVVEMGMRGLGEIAYLARIAQPNIGVITNINEIHIERLGSKENIAKAKSELIESLQGNESLAVLNFDDPLVNNMKELTSGQVLTYGLSEKANIHGAVVKHDHEGLVIEYSYLGEKSEKAKLPFYGVHQLSNALAAITVARFLGRSNEEIQTGWQKITPSPMRMEPMKICDIFVLNDAYNGSGMRESLKTFKEIGQGYQVALLGDMLEMGERAESAHERVLQLGLELELDLLLVTGEEMKKAAQKIGNEKIISFSSKEEVTNILNSKLHSGDSLLVKGSRGMKMESFLEAWKEIVETNKERM